MPKVPVVSIVDDDESVRVAAERLVRSFGFVALTFSSANHFLQSSRVDDTSCLIADVQMPGMSGTELQSALLARGKSVPIIFITAFPDEKVRARALAAGAVGFLNKPLDGAVLIRCIDTALGRRHNDG